MKVNILEKGKNKLKFEAEGISIPIANALRRTMVVEVPTLAIEEVNFRLNDSPLFDEVIAHRMGLIPMEFPAETLKKKDDCTCEGEGCINCEVVFVLEKTGPCMVYSKDLKSTNPEVKPVFDDIPITKLGEGQKLALEATAIIETGKKDIKWKASNTHYTYDENKKFTFTVESISGLKPKEIVTKASEIIEEKSNELTKLL